VTKYTHNIKFQNIILRVLLGRELSGPFIVLSFNAVYKGRPNQAYLPMPPSKMEEWLIKWADENQTMLASRYAARAERWEQIHRRANIHGL